MIFLMTFLGILISLGDNPVLILLSIISLSFIVSMPLMVSSYMLILFIWILVYIGGMMIVFTYVVFFSNYTSPSQEVKPLENLTKKTSILGGVLTLKKLIMTSSNFKSIFLFNGLQVVGNGSIPTNMESFFQFTFMSELGISTIGLVFFLVGIVLLFILLMFKATTTQQQSSLK